MKNESTLESERKDRYLVETRLSLSTMRPVAGITKEVRNRRSGHLMTKKALAQSPRPRFQHRHFGSIRCPPSRGPIYQQPPTIESRCRPFDRERLAQLPGLVHQQPYCPPRREPTPLATAPTPITTPTTTPTTMPRKSTSHQAYVQRFPAENLRTRKEVGPVLGR